jgi:hypothetical protein
VVAVQFDLGVRREMLGGGKGREGLGQPDADLGRSAPGAVVLGVVDVGIRGEGLLPGVPVALVEGVGFPYQEVLDFGAIGELLEGEGQAAEATGLTPASRRVRLRACSRPSHS